MCGWMDGWVDGWRDGWMNGCLSVQIPQDVYQNRQLLTIYSSRLWCFTFHFYFDSPRIVRPSKGRGVARRGCSSSKHDQTMAAFERSWKAARSEEIYALQVLAFRLDRPIEVAVCWVLQPWNSLFFFFFRMCRVRGPRWPKNMLWP